MNYLKNLKQQQPSHIYGNLETFNFGPIICHTSLEKTFIKELRSRGDKSNISHNKELAGHLDIENSYNEEDRKWFMYSTTHIFKNYVNKLKLSINEMGNKPPLTGVNLSALWINYMKKSEFNPLHDHFGDISFVIYLQVPNEIKEENKRFQGQGSGPGVISFYYGERNENMRTQHHFLPNEGDMFMFPAATKHIVPPFKSDVTRISVSGNLEFVFDT